MNSSITSRADARRLGLKTYYTGLPCSRGHNGPRYVSGSTCVACALDRSRAFYHSDIERSKVERRKWAVENAPLRRQHRKNWRDRNEVVVRTQITAWRDKNPAKQKIYEANRRARKHQATLPGYEAEIAAIYDACPAGYHVDHIIPLKGRGVCGFHAPWNLQYLLGPANRSKGNKFDPALWPEQGQAHVRRPS